MGNADIEKTIRAYLPQIMHMSLATCINNKPWVCEVHFAYDNDLNLYWRSKESRRHSREIAINPHVAGNIVEQHGQSEKPRGVYFEGTAKLLRDVEVGDKVYDFFVNRFNLGPEIIDNANSEDGDKFYKIEVEHIYLFDVRESKPAQKYRLER